MKRMICIFALVALLCGCQKNQDGIDSALTLRKHILDGNGCSFTAEITADYGNDIYQFTLNCQGDKQGNLKFSVASPESISGITGSITDIGGALTFDGAVLGFPPIADGQLTPVTAPWIFLKTLRSGYIVSCAEEDAMTYLQIDDSYSDRALHLDIWLEGGCIPVRAEILWEGRRILSLSVREFTIL